MKGKKKWIIGGSVLGMLLLLLAGMVLWKYPGYHPLHVPKLPFQDFSYTVYADHVELEKYYGRKEEVRIPDILWGKPVTVVGIGCFEYNESMQKVILPKELEIIGLDAFLRCRQLQEVAGGEKVRVIGQTAFMECKQLSKTGGLGESVEELGSGAFADCHALTYFPFTENLKYIWAGAFTNAGIETVDKVSSVVYMEEHIFLGTPWLAKQTEDFVTYNDILIWYQGGEKKVVIPEGVKGLAVKFHEIEGIEEIYVPSSAEYILRGSLIFCKGVRLYIPKEVEKIGYAYNYEGKGRNRSLDFSEEENGNIIVTTAGSPAEAYAREFGYACEIVEGW